MLKKVMLTGAKLTRPALTGSPSNCGKSPLLVSRSGFPLSSIVVSSSCFAVSVYRWLGVGTFRSKVCCWSALMTSSVTPPCPTRH